MDYQQYKNPILWLYYTLLRTASNGMCTGSFNFVVIKLICIECSLMDMFLPGNYKRGIKTESKEKTLGMQVLSVNG